LSDLLKAYHLTVVELDRAGVVDDRRLEVLVVIEDLEADFEALGKVKVGYLER
jgi:hypothetical protein